MKISRIYTPEQALVPVWRGDIIYHESVMYLEDEFRAKLLHTPKEVFCVLSFDYTVEYERGVDWELEGDTLVRLPGSRIPAFPLEEYYPEAHVEWQSFACTVPGHAYLKYGEWEAFQQYQIVISYRHEDAWQAAIPKNQGESFRRFFQKLSRGEEATIVFYGDSITTGCNATSLFDHAPYTPSFTYMVADAIAKKYGYRLSLDADPYMTPLETPLSGERVLHYVNTAVGGMDCIWGLENVQERVCQYKPDLFVLAFGMNDGAKTPEEYIGVTADTVCRVRQAKPESDVCLIATMLPHWRAEGFFGHQIEFEAALQTYARTLDAAAVAPVTSVHKHLLKGKEYYTMTGNNINHANDFLVRIYAMTILQTLGLYEEE